MERTHHAQSAGTTLAGFSQTQQLSHDSFNMNWTTATTTELLNKTTTCESGTWKGYGLNK